MTIPPAPPPGPEPVPPDGPLDGPLTPEECGHLVETLHTDDMTPARIRQEVRRYRQRKLENP